MFTITRIGVHDRQNTQLAHAEGNHLLINGLNGDDLFGGVRFMYADLIRQKQFSTIINSIISSEHFANQTIKFLNYGVRPLLPNWVKKIYRSIKGTSDETNEYQIQEDQINSLESELLLNKPLTFQQEKLLKLIYYRNSSECIYFLRKWLYLKYDLDCVLPYYNKEMLEFMWTLPVRLLEKSGRFRGLQINALNQLNLQHIANRKDKTSFMQLLEQGLADNKHLIKAYYQSSALIQENLIEAKDVSRLIASIDSESPKLALVYFVLTEIWWKKTKGNNSSFNSPYIKKF